MKLAALLLLLPLTSWADVYPNDDFGRHKLCIANPWQNSNWRGDNSSAWPCHYDYAVYHVPTIEAELADLRQQIQDLQAGRCTNTGSLLEQVSYVVQSNKDLFQALHLVGIAVSMFLGLSFGKNLI